MVALSRFLPLPPNFSAVGALALFGGFLWKDQKWALLVPVVIMMVSDLFLGLHVMMTLVYLSFAATVLIGQKIKKNHWLSVAGGAFLSSALFFVVTNLGVWWMTDMYASSVQGLVNCFVAAVPFFKNTLASQLLFSAVLFGGYAFTRNWSSVSSATATTR